MHFGTKVGISGIRFTLLNSNDIFFYRAYQSRFFSFSGFPMELESYCFVIFYHCFCYHCKMVLLFSFPRETKYKSCVSCTFLAWRGDWPSLLHKRDFIVHLSQKSSRIGKYLHQCKWSKRLRTDIAHCKKNATPWKKWCILEAKKTISNEIWGSLFLVENFLSNPSKNVKQQSFFFYLWLKVRAKVFSVFLYIYFLSFGNFLASHTFIIVGFVLDISIIRELPHTCIFSHWLFLSIEVKKKACFSCHTKMGLWHV